MLRTGCSRLSIIQPLVSQEIEEEDPYEGFAIHDNGRQIFSTSREAEREILQYRIWNQFVKITDSDDEGTVFIRPQAVSVI